MDRQGAWWWCAPCPRCKRPLPFIRLPGYDPADPQRTGLRAFNPPTKTVECRECGTLFEWVVMSGQAVWISEEDFPRGPSDRERKDRSRPN